MKLDDLRARLRAQDEEPEKAPAVTGIKVRAQCPACYTIHGFAVPAGQSTVRVKCRDCAEVTDFFVEDIRDNNDWLECGACGLALRLAHHNIHRARDGRPMCSTCIRGSHHWSAR